MERQRFFKQLQFQLCFRFFEWFGENYFSEEEKKKYRDRVLTRVEVLMELRGSCPNLMVCSIWSGKMTALARLVDAGSFPRTARGNGVLNKLGEWEYLTGGVVQCLPNLPNLDCELSNLIFKVQLPLHSVSFTEEASYQKLAAQSIGRELQDADEANLINEEDMHIFGLRPMADYLDLVCCNACKKPIKASHYAMHAELCKSLSSRAEINVELDGPAVTKKPPRKERKKSQITQSTKLNFLNMLTEKAKSLRETKNSCSVDSCDVAAPGYHIDAKSQISLFPEARREMHMNSTDKMNGSTVNPYSMDCVQDVTKHSLKPLKRHVAVNVTSSSRMGSPIAGDKRFKNKSPLQSNKVIWTSAENQSNQGTENFYKPAAELLPYVPAPLATKIYYSQRNHNLRRAISRMFFEEPDKEFSNEVPSSEEYQVNVALGKTSCLETFCHEQVARHQVPVSATHLFFSYFMFTIMSSKRYG
ncbi:hypothetical protein SASPL_100362 [Salvia splendens]|uniref:SAGA-associated factor 11 n=1 Tax=Salvia splendens TaxID=180675 RepID=A0A8X8YM88_SALSN|nr:hypothetical protein SASPL_100362 [Salvia splendens]